MCRILLLLLYWYTYATKNNRFVQCLSVQNEWGQLNTTTHTVCGVKYTSIRMCMWTCVYNITLHFIWTCSFFFFWSLTRAPMNLASSNSCLRGSSAAWKWCSILTLAPKRNTKYQCIRETVGQMRRKRYPPPRITIYLYRSCIFYCSISELSTHTPYAWRRSHWTSVSSL